MKALIAALVALSTIAAVLPANATVNAPSIRTFDGPGFGPSDLGQPNGPAYGPRDAWIISGPQFGPGDLGQPNGPAFAPASIGGPA